MNKAVIRFADGSQMTDLPQPGFELPHPLQGMVLPLVARYGDTTKPIWAPRLFLRPTSCLRHFTYSMRSQPTSCGVTERAVGCTRSCSRSIRHTTARSLARLLVTRHFSTLPGVDLALLTIDWPAVDGDPLSPLLPRLTFQPPPVDSSVLAIGYTEMNATEITQNSDGTLTVHHAHRMLACQGAIQELHPNGRDRSFVPFPAFRANYPSPHGMSGGPVFTEQGHVCGVVSTSYDLSEGGGADLLHASLLPDTLRGQGVLPRGIHRRERLGDLG